MLFEILLPGMLTLRGSAATLLKAPKEGKNLVALILSLWLMVF